MATLRRWLRGIVPRALWERLRAAVNRRRVTRVEEICLREMVRSSAAGLAAGPAMPRYPGTPLRRIVVVADVMWEENELVPELRKLCEVEVHDLRPALRGQPAATAPATIVRSVERFLTTRPAAAPDVVLLYLRGNLLSEELFALLRKHWSCPLLGMNLDDKVSFWDYGSAGGGDHYQHWAPEFDLNLTNSKLAATWYRQAGAACVYLPPAMRRPAALGVPGDEPYRHEISFVGSPKVDREALIQRLRDVGLPVEVFGKGWAGGAWVEDPVAIYRASQINLGLGMATPRLSTTKNRDFECPGVGACYLTTYHWELAEWWDIGREILCYRNPEELMEIACWYRQHPAQCRQIARAAWRRATAEHTWEIRFRTLFRDLGFALTAP